MRQPHPRLATHVRDDRPDRAPSPPRVEAGRAAAIARRLLPAVALMLAAAVAGCAGVSQQVGPPPVGLDMTAPPDLPTPDPSLGGAAGPAAAGPSVAAGVTETLAAGVTGTVAAGAPGVAAPGGAGAAPSPAPYPDWDTLYVERQMMSDFPCHQMGGGMMGDCKEEDIARAISFGLLEVDAAAAPGTPCRLEDRRIVGDCTDEDIARINAETIIVVDPGTDPTATCRVEGTRILGPCDQAMIESLRKDIRATRGAP